MLPAAVWMLLAISRVVAPCSSTAAAIEVETEVSSWMLRRDRADLVDGALGRLLDGGDLLGNLLGRARGLVGERLHLGGHHREALAGLAGARRLDGGIERQQIGLRGDLGNQPDHRADALRRLVERADGLVGPLGVGDRRARHLQAARGLLADLLDRVRQLFGRGHGEIDALAGFRRGGGRRRHPAQRVFGHLLHGGRGRGERAGRLLRSRRSRRRSRRRTRRSPDRSPDAAPTRRRARAADRTSRWWRDRRRSPATARRSRSASLAGREAVLAPQHGDGGPQHGGGGIHARAALEAEHRFPARWCCGSSSGNAEPKSAFSSSRNCPISMRRNSPPCFL